MTCTNLWFCSLCLVNWLELSSVTIRIIAAEQYFSVILLIMLYKVAFTFESVDEILKCDYSNKTYHAVPSRGAACLFTI